MLSIEGAVRPGSEFKLTAKPTYRQASTFAVLHAGGLFVTAHPVEVIERFGTQPDLPVLAHWHGEWRTDGFAMTVGHLATLIADWGTR